ncbi:MAG: outer membrane beta-barrel protein [Bacteroidia bacterium]|jgi:hypothetical protein
MKSFGLFCFSLLLSLALWAQEPVDSLAEQLGDDEEVLDNPDVNPESKTGIILGTGFCRYIGKEPNNPALAMMLSGGFYHRVRFKPHWSFQPALMISLKGSNFDNDTGSIGSIKSYHVDVPILFLYGLNENNTSNIIGGLQYSRLLSAVLYRENYVFPEDIQPALSSHDLSLAGGMQYHTPFVGFQFILKYGLLNTNRGFIQGILPLNEGKSMHQFTFEASLIF